MEMVHNRKEEIKQQGKKLKDEPMIWSKWMKKEGWNDTTYKRYVGVYFECLAHPELLKQPLGSFYGAGINNEEAADPIKIGTVMYVHERQPIPGHGGIQMMPGNQVELIDYDPTKDAKYRHRWQIIDGKHVGVKFGARPILFKLEAPKPAPKSGKKRQPNWQHTKARNQKSAPASANTPPGKLTICHDTKRFGHSRVCRVTRYKGRNRSAKVVGRSYLSRWR